MTMLKKLKKEWFLLGLVLAIVAASFSAPVGRSGGLLNLQVFVSIGVATVFFLHGLGLSPKDIKAGIKNWRLHVFIQLATFALYPLIWVLCDGFFLSFMPSALAFGFCYLFVLPSTISSSVTMTGVAKGNVPGAIFNASLSSILGVFITPFLIQTFMKVEGVQLDYMSSVKAIFLLLIIPMLVGQLARPVLSGFVKKHKGIIGKIDKYVIIMIVYNAFCDSIHNRIWSDFSLEILLLSIVICIVILLCMVHSIQWLAGKVGFSLPDEAAAVFCGTKKTLAAGIPMAKLIFVADPNLGMILLPIMLYHPIQIFYCAILANKYAAKAPSAA